MKYQLKKPIKLGETETITELVFREEVCAGDLRGIKASALSDPSIDDILKIGGRLCAQPDPVMNKLSMADLDKVGELILGFFSAGPETGTKQ